MLDIFLLAAVVLSSVVGGCVGFLTGLVPGLHMNNVAAAVTTNASVMLAVFCSVSSGYPGSQAGLLVSCFISAALVAHLFSESITSTYVGIPSEDVVSVLPAHRLARSGLGTLAVMTSAEGTLAGVLAGSASLFPICMIMGSPCNLYEAIRMCMPALILFFVTLMLLSEGYPSLDLRTHLPDRFYRIGLAVILFLSSGVLGTAVLMTGYYAARVPDFPWMPADFVQKSSLLLPMFAGFFGIPSLILSVSSEVVSHVVADAESGRHKPSRKDLATCLLGGTMVGWLPGMTSGSAATVCSPSSAELSGAGDLSSATRFIWLYSAISSSGAVMSVGALFVILRARSGSMDALEYFLGSELGAEEWPSSIPTFAAILLAMLVSSLFSFWMVGVARRRMPSIQSLLRSRALALSSLVFVLGLSLWLTGARGALVMSASTSLGLIPPLLGIRRIQLMGSLLVPILILYLTML